MTISRKLFSILTTGFKEEFFCVYKYIRDIGHAHRRVLFLTTRIRFLYFEVGHSTKTFLKINKQKKKVSMIRKAQSHTTNQPMVLLGSD